MKKDKAEILGRLYALYEKTEKDKAELLGIIEQNKTELLGIIESNRIELNAKIDTIYLKLDRKITLWSFSIIFIIIFLNQNALEFIAKIIGLIK
jgi:hypothetical protein